MDKKQERVKYKLIRESSLSKVEGGILNQVNNLLTSRICSNEFNGCIGIYWPLKGEPNILQIKNNFDVNFALPSCLGKSKIVYYKWNNKPLINDFCGIPSPKDEIALSPEEIDLLLIPGLAIDKNGQRLGYGGGFYDRLRKHPSWRAIKALVVLPKACISKEPLPQDSWDIPYNGWIDEDGLHELFP